MSLRDLARRLRAARRGAVPRRAALEPRIVFETPRAEPRLDEPLEPALQARLDAVADEHPALHLSMERLDVLQQRAVLAPEDAVLVRAHVGSGKTTVLVHRVLWHHLVDEIPLDRMAVLTFTVRAAEEMQERIAALRGRPSEPGDFLWTGTFHAVARQLLIRHLPVEELGVERDFDVLDRDGAARLRDELIREHGLVIKYRDRLGRRLERLAEGAPLYGSMRHPDDLERLVELYDDAKRARNVLDFDDLIDGADRLLERLPDEARPAAIVVDELQDCDSRQVALVRRLAGSGTTVFAVGDPHQVIYSWRGSRPRIFEETRAAFGAVERDLRVNYRSTGAIVECARALLPSGGPGLVAVRERGLDVVVQRHHSPLQEALYLAGRLAELHEDEVPWREMAVLFRIHDQAAPLADALCRAEIPWVGAAEGEGAAEGVRLLTFHAAKGLEFRYVFIVGANDGLIPLATAWKLADLEAEERRLFFVAMTRARDALEISWLTEPEAFSASSEPSPYLDLLPPTMVDRVDEGVAAPVSAAPPSSSGLTVGDGVIHTRYGPGVVTRVATDAITCAFEGHGEKDFSLQFCPIEKI